jgi:hypothetical protein
MAANQDFIADRRRCLRQTVHAPAFAAFDGVTGGMILDLSAEGMAMRTAAPLRPLQRVQLQVDLTEPTAHLETTGYIAWADALGRAGVRFSELPEDARRRLNEWLTVNADAPSSMAPKLSLRGTARASGWSIRDGRPEVAEGHVSLSLEPETDAMEMDAMDPNSGDEDDLIMEIAARGGTISRESVLPENAARGNAWPQNIPRQKPSQNPSPNNSSNVWPTGFSGTVQYEFNSLSTDLNAALRLIGERARSLTRGTSAAIALAHNGSVMCRASIGPSAPSLGTKLDVNSGFSGECFRTGKSLRCDDAEIDNRVDMESCRRLGVRSILAAPIRSERETVGLLAVFGEQSFNFDEGDVAVVESLAHTVLLTMSRREGRMA